MITVTLDVRDWEIVCIALQGRQLECVRASIVRDNEENMDRSVRAGKICSDVQRQAALAQIFEGMLDL